MMCKLTSSLHKPGGGITDSVVIFLSSMVQTCRGFVSNVFSWDSHSKIGSSHFLSSLPLSWHTGVWTIPECLCLSVSQTNTSQCLWGLLLKTVKKTSARRGAFASNKFDFDLNWLKLNYGGKSILNLVFSAETQLLKSRRHRPARFG